MSIAETIMARALEYYRDTGEPRVYVTPEEFQVLQQEAAAQALENTMRGLHTTSGALGNYAGFDVVVGEPPA